eukprot:gene10658-14313_t
MSNQLDFKCPIIALAPSPNRRYCAITASHELRLVSLNLLSGNGNNLFEVEGGSQNQIRCQYSTLDKQIGGAYATDLAWSNCDERKIAVSFSSGSIITMLFTPKGPNTATKLQLGWNSGRIASRINKICWHPSESDILACCGTDGIIKILDLRVGSNMAQTPTTYKSNGSIRDVKFSPHDSNLFADGSELGGLRVWDRRHTSKPILSKYNAHNQHILTLEWNPNASKDGILATGSKDRLVRVWDISSCGFDGNRDGSNHADGSYEPALLHTVHTTNEVHRLKWRIGKRFHSQFATASLEENSLISIWDTLLPPYIPLCVLKGHQTNSCADFHWLSELEPFQTSENNMKIVNPSTIKYAKQMVSDRERDKRSPISSMLISASRDGKIIIQDLNSSTFPYEDVDCCTTAISAQGHVAFHRAIKLDQDFRSRRGVLLGSTELISPSPLHKSHSLRGTAIPSEDNESPYQNNLSKIGSVFVGIAEITDLRACENIRSTRGAEAGVFDPALISLLARRYTFPLLNLQVMDKVKEYSEAVSICNKNLIIAQDAGLVCRAAVWTTVMSLLPQPSIFEMKPTPILPVTFSRYITSLSFGTKLLGSLLSELLEGGDSQHFVAVYEIFKKVGIHDEIKQSAGISEVSVRRTYLAYVDLLMKLQLFCEATEILKLSNDKHLCDTSKSGIDMKMKCGMCEKELEKGRLPYCRKCKRCAAICAICNQPVRGLLQWCPVCAHGGHLDCCTRWFQLHSSCPSGCKHDCCFSLLQSPIIPPDNTDNEHSNSNDSKINILSKYRTERRSQLKSKLLSLQNNNNLSSLLQPSELNRSLTG